VIFDETFVVFNDLAALVGFNAHVCQPCQLVCIVARYSVVMMMTMVTEGNQYSIAEVTDTLMSYLSIS